ncbi:hypothetical protein C7974DRAFT_476539 [Boeremia exigua]|uniref:uncharacterized protein n=1 Tax=Boeremia exigua TaxID=749465 RepID=UPI001E8D5404|nr:uncharacterized protein C7974DRAFT_476539 [Boeremia exigua]KAH6612724.1 hypothetical protein C7974DRAFT_476539 [Boeremia exigua]
MSQEKRNILVDTIQCLECGIVSKRVIVGHGCCVLDHQRRYLNKITASFKGYEEGRESLVGADGRSRSQPGKKPKLMHRTANITTQNQPSATTTIKLTLEALNDLRTTHTIPIEVMASATSKPEGSARVQIESLPGQNQDKPTLDAAKLEVPVLPGVNQDTSRMGDIPVSPAAALTPSQVPAIIVDRPLPGQNQVDPIMGELAPLLISSMAPEPYVLPSNPPSSTPSVASQVSATSMSTLIAQSTSVSLDSSSVVGFSTSFTIPSFTSFLTSTRSEQSREEASVTLALPSPSAVALTTSTTSSDTTKSATSQAIAAAQSAPGILTSTAAVAVASQNSTAESEVRNGSILNPMARTLLIVFVVLGVLSVIVAITISIMVRSHRKRFQTKQNDPRTRTAYDTSDRRADDNPHISTDTNDNPFLTASEKAIIDRAASPDRDSDLNSSYRLSEASIKNKV